MLSRLTCLHVEQRARHGLLENALALDFCEGRRLAGRRKLVGKRVKAALVVGDGDLLPELETSTPTLTARQKELGSEISNPSAVGRRWCSFASATLSALIAGGKS